MNKKQGLSLLDGEQVLRDTHNEDNRALDVVSVNDLVPSKFSKVNLVYIQSGDGAGEVGEALYYSNGEYHKQTITCRKDELGSAHKTSVSFYNRSASNLAGKYFIIFDDVGPVGVYFNLNGQNQPPQDSSVYRFISVLITSQDSEIDLATKLVSTLNQDAKFFAVGNQAFLVISNRSAGARADSFDKNSNLYIKNTAGLNPNTLNNTFFYINSASNQQKYYVWYSVDNTGSDPLISNKTGIKVVIPAGATANQVASATGAALSTLFLTNIIENKLVITNLLIGVTTAIQDVNVDFLDVSIDVQGADRTLVAHVILTYNSTNELISVERL